MKFLVEVMTFRLVENGPLNQSFQFFRVVSQSIHQVHFTVVAEAWLENSIAGDSYSVAITAEFVADGTD
jgi:hypothetical protein